MDDRIETAKQMIRNSGSIAVLTGAGISSDSGIPTFRGEGGLWRNFSPQQLATPQAFQRDPKLVWEWYNWRREVISKAKPNAAHHTLRKMEETKDNFWIITQNIDGLHTKAGNKKVIEFHGNIWREKCSMCDFRRYNEVVYDPQDIPPRCPICGGFLRPDVVWFGEMVPQEVLEKAISIVELSDTFLIIGTSGVVYPAAYLAELAITRRKNTIEINREMTPFSELVTVSILGRAAELLPKLV